jgi:uncharacterized protein
MSLATARKIVEFAFMTAPRDERIDFGFFGGEPLLCNELMRAIIADIEVRQRQTRRAISFSVTTNGLLLTPMLLTFFRRHNVDVCISLDGPAAVHNRNRQYPNGKGSFHAVLNKLRLALRYSKTVQVNAVYEPDTLMQLPETIAFLTQLGASVLHVNPNITAEWDDRSCHRFRDIYLQLAQHYIHLYQSGREMAFNLLDSKIILLLKNGYTSTDTCQMGEGEWGFAPNGDIYPCERFIRADGSSPFCIGNIHTGINHVGLQTVLRHRGNRNPECARCPDRRFCMNWCGCTNYYMTGHSDRVGSMMCASERAALHAARTVLMALHENDGFLDHFFAYLHTGKSAVMPSQHVYS